MSEYENAADPSHQEYLEQMVKENQNKQVPFMERMSAAHDEVLAEFSKYWKQLVWNTPSMYQGFKEFIKEIDWSEKWIQSILAVQACILLTLILFRRNMAVQNTIFVTSVGVIYFADRLNAWGAAHWEKFAKHNYFEPNGAFVSLLISAPLLIGMLIVLTNYAVHFMWTLVYMKTEQLKRRARRAGQGSKESTRGTSAPKSRKNTQQKKKQ